MILFICQIVGGILVACSWIPQIFQAIKQKNAHEVDLKPLLFLFLGSLLMEVYAISLLFEGIAIAFFITTTLNLVVVTSLIGIVFWYVPDEDEDQNIDTKKVNHGS